MKLYLEEYPTVAQDLQYFWEHPEIYEEDKLRLYDYYCKAKVNGKIVVNYEKKRFNGKLYGRLFPNGKNYVATYQWNKVRSLLFQDEHDIDIVNAHPVILSQLYKQLFPTKSCPVLDNYIANRDKYINEIEIKPEAIARYNTIAQDNKEKRDIVKTLFTLTIYGGGLTTWMDTFKLSQDDFNLNNLYKPFRQELTKIAIDILSHDNFKELVFDVKTQWEKDGKISNTANKEQKAIENHNEAIAIQSSVKQEELTENKTTNKIETDTKKLKHDNTVFKLLAVILQTIECSIVKKAIDMFRYSKYQVTVYMYDGFQIKNKSQIDKPLHQTTNNANYEDILKVINNTNIKGPNKFGKFTYKVQFIAKPFKEKLDLSLLATVPKWKLNVCNLLTDNTMMNLVSIIKDNLDGNCICSKKQFYRYNGKQWEEATTMEVLMNENTNGMYMGRLELYENLLQIIKKRIHDPTRMKALVRLIGNDGFTKALRAVASEITNDKIEFDMKCELLNCNNGTINLDTAELQPHCKYDYITKMIKFDYNKLYESQESYNAIEDIFTTWLIEKDNQNEIKKIVEYFLFILSTCLHGNNPMQKAIVLIGATSRNGKGTFMKFLNNTFDDYVGTLKKEYFTAMNEDSCKPQPDLLNAMKCRYIDVAESDGSKGEQKFGNNFKKFTGKDIHILRDLYGKKSDIQRLIPQGTGILSCNENIDFTKESNAMINRLLYIRYANYFGDESMAGWDEKFSFCKRIDPTFEKKLNNEKMQLYFFHTLLWLRKKYGGVYTSLEMPEYMKAYQKEYKDEVDTIAAWCRQNIITDETPFSESNKYDEYWLYRNSKLEGKERVLTFDYILEQYKKETKQVISMKAFSIRLRQIYNGKSFCETRLFGGRKKAIIGLRLIDFEEPDS